MGFVFLLGPIWAQSHAKALILLISGSILGSILEAQIIKKSITFWYHFLIDFWMVWGLCLTLFLNAFWIEKLSYNEKGGFMKSNMFTFVFPCFWRSGIFKFDSKSFQNELKWKVMAELWYNQPPNFRKVILFLNFDPFLCT